MNVKVNGEDKNLEFDTISVRQILTVCEVDQPDMVSVQVNGQFVNRSDFDGTDVKDGDEVDFLYFMGGGAK